MRKRANGVVWEREVVLRNGGERKVLTLVLKRFNSTCVHPFSKNIVPERCVDTSDQCVGTLHVYLRALQMESLKRRLMCWHLIQVSTHISLVQKAMKTRSVDTGITKC